MSLDSIRYSDHDAPDEAGNALPGSGVATRSERFRAFVDGTSFPCVGAKAALARDAIDTIECGSIVDPGSDQNLLTRIHAFGAMLDACDPDDTTLHSLVAIFSDTQRVSEQAFETQLWTLLQRLHHIDARNGVQWPEAISRDPQSPKFSLGLGGVPYFVIGLHPNASRVGRRFPHPVLVFNSHRQFEALRADGRYQKMQKATRARDVRIAGFDQSESRGFRYGIRSAPVQRSRSGRGLEMSFPRRRQVAADGRLVAGHRRRFGALTG